MSSHSHSDGRRQSSRQDGGRQAPEREMPGDDLVSSGRGTVDTQWQTQRSVHPDSWHGSSASRRSGSSQTVRLAEEPMSNNITVLRDHIDTHDFLGPSVVEQRFFMDPNFDIVDLRAAMLYAIEAANAAVDQYNLSREKSPYYKLAEHGAVVPRMFLEARGFEVDWDILQDVDYMAGWKEEDVMSMEVNANFVRSIAIFGIVKANADRSTAMLVERNAGSIERSNKLEQWVKAQDRMNAKPKSTPIALLDPGYTQDDLKAAAIYAKGRRLRYIEAYQGTREAVIQRCTPAERLQMTVLSDEQLLAAEVTAPEMMDLKGMADDHIMALDFAAVEEPIDMTQLTSFKESKVERLRRQMVDRYDKEARDAKRQQHKSFYWALAMLAKDGVRMANHCQSLSNQMAQIGGER